MIGRGPTSVWRSAADTTSDPPRGAAPDTAPRGCPGWRGSRRRNRGRLSVDPVLPVGGAIKRRGMLTLPCSSASPHLGPTGAPGAPGAPSLADRGVPPGPSRFHRLHAALGTARRSLPAVQDHGGAEADQKRPHDCCHDHGVAGGTPMGPHLPGPPPSGPALPRSSRCLPDSRTFSSRRPPGGSVNLA